MKKALSILLAAALAIGLLALMPLMASAADADKTDLGAAISFFLGLAETNYTPASWADADAAYQIALGVFNDNTLTDEDQDAVDQANADFRAAMAALVIIPADKTALGAAIDAFLALTEAEWTHASWAVAFAAYQAAQGLYDDDTIYVGAQGLIDGAEAAVSNTIAALVAANPADKSDLGAAINAFLALKWYNFSTASWAPANAAYLIAKGLFDDNTLNEEDQGAIDGAEAALTAAIAALDGVDPADKDALEEAINKYLALNAGSFKESTWAPVVEAYLIAKGMLDDITLNEEKQGDIDQATATLLAAIDALPAIYALVVNGGTGSGSYEEGLAVAISAITPAGKAFVSWTVTGGGRVVPGEPNDANTTFIMPASAAMLTANFRPLDYVRIFNLKTAYEWNFGNWFMFIFLFGWIWMWFTTPSA